jgi:hypothetical protein
MKKPTTTTKPRRVKISPPVFPFPCEARRGRPIEKKDCTPNPELPACQTCPLNRYRQWQETEKQKQEENRKVVILPKAKKVGLSKPKKTKPTKPRASHTKTDKKTIEDLQLEFGKRSTVLENLFYFLKSLRVRPDWNDLGQADVEKLLAEYLAGLYEYEAHRKTNFWNHLEGPATLSEAVKWVENHFINTRENKLPKSRDVLGWVSNIIFVWATGEMTGPFDYATLDQWLKHRKEIDDENYEWLFQYAVRDDIRQDIEGFFVRYLREYEVRENRQPSISELIGKIDDYFGPARLSHSKPQFLRIQLLKRTQEEVDRIVEKVRAVLNRHRLDTRFLADYLNRYLKVYDRGEKAITGKKTDKTRRQAKIEFEKARVIISTLENKGFMEI